MALPTVTSSSVQTHPAPRNAVQSVSRPGSVSLQGALQAARDESHRPLAQADESAHVAPAPPVAPAGGV